MMTTQTTLPLDTWLAIPWQEYEKAIASPMYEKAKSYYYQEHARIEMSPVSLSHGRDHIFIVMAVGLFGIVRVIPMTGLDTCTFRKAGFRECQPDAAYYLGAKANLMTAGTGIVNLDRSPAPDLVIEVAKTSLLDDLGTKRSLYEEIGVGEYWIVDVAKSEIIAYAMADQGSRKISESIVLPGLPLNLLSEALDRSRTSDQSQVLAWLLSQFNNL